MQHFLLFIRVKHSVSVVHLEPAWAGYFCWSRCYVVPIKRNRVQQIFIFLFELKKLKKKNVFKTYYKNQIWK